jgi:thiol-disulfide isomerase/thioredoxin
MAAVATAASAALPPDRRMASPASVASGWLDATMPWRAYTVDRRDWKRIGASALGMSGTPRGSEYMPMLGAAASHTYDEVISGRATLSTVPMAMKKCPVCGVSVKVENLEKHVRNQHPRAGVDTASLLTDEERGAAREAKTASRPGLTSSGKRTIAIVAVVVAVLLVVAVLFTVLTLTLTSGGSVTLSQYRGMPVLLEFMNAYCPNCQAEAPVLVSLFQAFGSRVHFLSVDIYLSPSEPASSAAELNTFKSQYGTNWDYAMDTDNSVAHAYVVQGTPTSFVIDANGVIHSLFYGRYPYSSFSDALNATLG